MSNSTKGKAPKKLTIKVGKRSLRTVSNDQLAGVTGGDGAPGCVPSPPPNPPCMTAMDQD